MNMEKNIWNSNDDCIHAYTFCCLILSWVEMLLDGTDVNNLVSISLKAVSFV